MARYRLRFLLQEFDLSPGTTYIGRSSDCGVTIEDPLVSRRHARVDVGNGVVTISDEGSRNGVRVNGQLIAGATILSSGDRIRIGTMEMVFTALHDNPHVAKTTGFLRHCGQCRLPYPEEAGVCPTCGASDVLEEDTVTGRHGDQRSWQLQLYLEVIERGLAAGRLEDAERNLRRASAELDLRHNQDTPLERAVWSQLTNVAGRYALAAQNAMWACWVVRLHRQLERTPDDETYRLFEVLRAAFPVEVTEAMREVSAFFLARPDLPGAADVVSRLSLYDTVDRAGAGHLPS